MAFELEITSRNLEVSDRVREYINKKVAKLDRHFEDIDEIKVDLAYVKSARSNMDRHVAQITARGKGFMLRAEERAEETFAALDLAIEKMERQIERYKGKRNRGRGDRKSLSEASIELNPDLANPMILRRKKFDLTPMDEEEALEQMKLLAHESFFIFFNIETKSINVIYRRNDGSYGSIEPVLPQ